jgi:hypothetical protein
MTASRTPALGDQAKKRRQYITYIDLIHAASRNRSSSSVDLVGDDNICNGDFIAPIMIVSSGGHHDSPAAPQTLHGYCTVPPSSPCSSAVIVKSARHSGKIKGKIQRKNKITA